MVERYTADGEWTEDELKCGIYDVCVEVMTKEFVEQYKHRALIDRDLLKHPYMEQLVLSQIDDVVELYDNERKKHTGDLDGIFLYDRVIKNMILKNIEENLAT